MTGLAEALSLGLASGPVCLGSCGPVLLPWLAAEGRALRGTAKLLATFLSGRLLGYLGFAAVAWAVGLVMPVDPDARILFVSFVNIGLAAILAWHAWHPWRRVRPAHELYSIEAKPRFHHPAALSLGFLTGLNLCPPFLVAGVRAAEARSLPAAMVFFLVFFAGTVVWFLPALAVASLRRIAAAATVARMIMLLLAAYYAYLGGISLYWRLSHD